MNRGNYIRYMCVISSITTLLTSCGSGSSQRNPEAQQTPHEALKTPGNGNPYPTFSRGGTISLNVQGQPASVVVDSVDLANTDSGYPDYLEISGPGTSLYASIEPKMPEGDGEEYYKPIVGRALPMNVSVDLMPTPREITIPNQGKYPVTGGSVTMEHFQIGMDGRDMWDGRIEVTVQTTQGPTTLTGTFKFCVVPVW